MEDDECTQPRSIKLTGKNRCYIFSNTFDNSTTLPKLPGYKKDEESITKLFKGLNFKVIYHFDKEQQALIKEINTIANKTDFDTNAQYSFSSVTAHLLQIKMVLNVQELKRRMKNR